MRRALCCLMVGLMIVLSTACGATADEPAMEAPEVVVFGDPLLESMVREQMGVPEGDITVEAAEALTALNVSIDWQQDPVPGSQITDISALKYFKNLENLDIQFHKISEISALADMTNLKALAIGGNQITDISPLSGLTKLDFLSLFNCMADDYTPLKNLAQLKTLFLGYSTIEDVSVLGGLTELETLTLNDTRVSDVSPLADLTKLKRLELADSNVTDFSTLAPIYPNLIEKDFILVQSLAELGFEQVDDFYGYKSDTDVVIVRFDNLEQENNFPVTVMPSYNEEKYFVIGYYPDNKTYFVTINDQSGALNQYNYDITTQKAEFVFGEQAEAESLISELLPDSLSENIWEAPIQLFNHKIAELFTISAEELYTLPFEVEKKEELSLLGQGFVEDPATASYYFEQKNQFYFNLQIYNPEWGTWEEGGDVRFFTPLSDEYRLVVTYFIDERKFLVAADDNDGGGAKFEFFRDTHESIDGWCSDPNITVEEYYIKAFNDSSIDDIYLYSTELMTNTIQETFDMSMEELYGLPSGK